MRKKKEEEKKKTFSISFGCTILAIKANDPLAVEKYREN